MRFEIPFQENIFIKEMQCLFDYSNKKYLKQSRNLLIFSIFFGLFGALVLYGKSDLGFLFLFSAFILLWTFYKRFSIYKEHKKKYFNSQNEHIKKRLAAIDSKEIFEFTEEHFYYVSDEVELKLKWEIFYSYKKIDKNILLIQTNKFLLFNFLISMEDVGYENFDKIIHFLETKIQNNGTL